MLNFFILILRLAHGATNGRFSVEKLFFVKDINYVIFKFRDFSRFKLSKPTDLSKSIDKNAQM